MDTSVRKSLISNYRKNRSIDEYRLLEKLWDLIKNVGYATIQYFIKIH